MEIVKNFDSKVRPAEKTKGSSGARIHRSTVRIVGRAEDLASPLRRYDRT